jgi:hypothetical protein
MNAKSNIADYLRTVLVLAAVIFPVVSVQANPIEVPEKSIIPEISFLIGLAILIEVICVWFILRCSRRPRFFILWLLGMHLITYPSFMGLLWLLQAMRPAFAVAIGEGLVVVVEGLIIYTMCWLLAPTVSTLSRPTLTKCWLASLVGNVCSAVAFPVLFALFKIIERSGSG